jgi:hypothetical protein
MRLGWCLHSVESGLSTIVMSCSSSGTIAARHSYALCHEQSERHIPSKDRSSWFEPNSERPGTTRRRHSVSRYKELTGRTLKADHLAIAMDWCYSCENYIDVIMSKWCDILDQAGERRGAETGKHKGHGGTGAERVVANDDT